MDNLAKIRQQRNAARDHLEFLVRKFWNYKLYEAAPGLMIERATDTSTIKEARRLYLALCRLYAYAMEHREQHTSL